MRTTILFVFCVLGPLRSPAQATDNVVNSSRATVNDALVETTNRQVMLNTYSNTWWQYTNQWTEDQYLYNSRGVPNGSTSNNMCVVTKLLSECAVSFGDPMATDKYEWNPDFYYKHLDGIQSFSVRWCTDNAGMNGVLITPRFVVVAGHTYTAGKGSDLIITGPHLDQFRFLYKDGRHHSADVTATKTVYLTNITAYGKQLELSRTNVYKDLRIAVLSAPVPDEIRPAQTFSPELKDFMGLNRPWPLLTGHGTARATIAYPHRKYIDASVSAVWTMASSRLDSQGNVIGYMRQGKHTHQKWLEYPAGTHPLGIPDDQLTDWWTGAQGGDSGSPYYMVVGTSMVWVGPLGYMVEDVAGFTNQLRQLGDKYGVPPKHSQPTFWSSDSYRF